MATGIPSAYCADALVVARFWAVALGRPLDPKPSSEFASIGMLEHRDPQGWRLNGDPTWLFNKVPEGKFDESRTARELYAYGRSACIMHAWR